MTSRSRVHLGRSRTKIGGWTFDRGIALTRTGSLTYAYNNSGFDRTMTVSAIGPVTKTFTAVSSQGTTYRWNDTLERLTAVTGNWNWRPQFSACSFSSHRA